MEISNKDLKRNNNSLYACASRTNYFVAIALVAMMTSCDKQDIAPIVDDEQSYKMTITAVKDDATSSSETKTSIDGMDFTWETYDELKLFAVNNGENSTASFTISGSGGSSSADFSGSLTASNELVYAAYTSDSYATFTTSDYTSKFVMSQEQIHTSGVTLNTESIGKYALMFGQSTGKVNNISETTTGVDIKMEHLTAILDFKINGIPKGTVLKGLGLNASSAIFPSAVSVNLSDGTRTFSEKQDFMRVALFDAYGTVGVTVGSDGELTIRLAMLPTSVPEAGTLTISLSIVDASGGTVVKSVVKTPGLKGNYKAGKVYDASFAYNELLPVIGEVTSNEAGTYPTVKVSDYHSIYIYDRNAGVNVPKNTDEPYSAGRAVNWINGDVDATKNKEAFKGDYYTWIEALVGLNVDGSAMCPEGWRLPTSDEITAIGGTNTNYIAHSNSVAILTGEHGNKCYFPLSGYSIEPSYVYGHYWSSTESKDFENRALFLFVFASDSYVNDVNLKSHGFSVRCIKTVE